MRQLYLYVEGQTERTFADEVLKPHLAQLERRLKVLRDLWLLRE